MGRSFRFICAQHTPDLVSEKPPIELVAEAPTPHVDASSDRFELHLAGAVNVFHACHYFLIPPPASSIYPTNFVCPTLFHAGDIERVGYQIEMENLVATVKEKAAGATVAASYSTDKELYATRYKQGGRTVYAVAMTPAQVASTIKRPDPLADNPGNRRIRLKHAQAFARYFIEHENWVVPGIILRASNIFSFAADSEVADVQFGVLKYAERNQGDIHILDGQHRILGFHIALEVVDDLLDKARSQRATARRVGEGEKEAEAEIRRLDAVRDRLYTERVSVEIQVTDDLAAYRQMFFDIAENALGITASVKARFDSRKVINRALPDVLEHPLLAGRVDLEQDRLPRRGPNFLTARHLTETVRVATVGYDGRVGRRAERELKEKEVAKNANEFFTTLTEAFVPLKSVELGQLLPDALRETTLLGSPLFLRILAGVYYDLIANHGRSRADVLAYFKKLAPHMNAPAHANSIWQLHAPEDAFQEGALAPSGRRQDAKALLNAIVEWDLDNESFVDEEPQPAPVVVEQEPSDDEILAQIESKAPKGKITGMAAEATVEFDKIAAESKARGRSRSTVKSK